MGGARGSFALTLTLIALVALADLGLRAAGALPPDDPLLFFTRTRAPRVDPFVDAGGGRVAIRPDWVNDGEGLRGRRGQRAGRQFLFPGFRPAEISRAKPEGTLRIVALGESTTYGLFVGADSAFISVLGQKITASTGLPVEAVNLGCAGFASDRVLALLPTALALSPDLVVVYLGQNEMLGGDAGPTGGLTPALRLRAALLARSSLFAWLDYGLTSLLRSAETERVREEVAALEAGEIPTFVQEAVPAAERAAPSEAFRTRAADGYRANLGKIIELGRAANVPLLFVLPVANLRAPPTFAHHEPGFEKQREFDAEMRAAAALRQAGKHADELAAVDRALALSPAYGPAHYARGEALRALGRDDEARAAYQRAIDGVTYRITSRLERVFVEVVGGAGVPWVDLRPLFHADLSDAAARALFVDHVHPTAVGHAKIAAALQAPALALLPLPSRARVGDAKE